MLVSLLITAVVGLLAGLAARAILPGRRITGVVAASLIGICGAVAASYAGQMLRYYKVGEPMSLVGAVVGALVLLFLWNLIFNR
jgi:uncharacterized membrane protein YeaQ/YmgE (transglycosylase-associated protein family)